MLLLVKVLNKKPAAFDELKEEVRALFTEEELVKMEI
jgi:hypothetical protein